jgi:DNA topoisomerase-1
MPRDTIDFPPAPTGAGARLSYVNDDDPGIRRIKSDAGFDYQDPDGAPVTKPATLGPHQGPGHPAGLDRGLDLPLLAGPHPGDRPRPEGPQAIPLSRGLAARPRRHEVRPDDRLRPRPAQAAGKRVEADLARRGLPREKVVAAVVRLMELTLIRIGNEEYAQANKSFGLTTLRDRHAKLSSVGGTFQFKGKSGKVHATGFRDPRLARIVKACQDVPGQRLFQYLDEDGQRRAVESADVNAYIRETIGEDFSAKDFRTWAGTLAAAQALCQGPQGRQRHRGQAQRQHLRQGGGGPAGQHRRGLPGLVHPSPGAGILPAGRAAAEARPLGPRL